MAAAPKPSEMDLARIRRWVAGRVPPQHADSIKIELGQRGANVTLFELRPPWCEEVGPDWSRRPAAQLRYTGMGFWRLFCTDRNGRWRPYPLNPEPERDLDGLLNVVSEDAIEAFGI